jgi:hypothetical protein
MQRDVLPDEFPIPDLKDIDRLVSHFRIGAQDASVVDERGPSYVPQTVVYPTIQRRQRTTDYGQSFR